MVNVLEHIDDDLEILQHLHTLLRPGGRVLIFVPALPWLYGSLDALVHHVRRYTRTELRERMQEAGFTIDTLTYFDVLGTLPWFFAGRVFRRQQFDQAGAELYDRFGVPVTRFFERRLSPPFGKSLLCVAHKSQPN
jgi:SAM-dependent methyltransferase